MAVKRSQNFINQQRVDVPHLRSIESAVRNDFDELFVSMILGESESYVIRGFEIEMAGSIGASANSLQMVVDNSSVLHGKSAEAGTFFNVSSGTTNQVLSSTTNERVDGAFTPSALNYISLEFTREVDDSTTDQLYLWNPTTKNEITKTLPLAQTLDYKIVISSAIFSPNVLPLAIVETDSSNNVLNVQDRRPMLFATASSGATTPNPFNEFDWVEGRSPNFWSSSSSSVSPFTGGDKQIKTFKDNDLALKTELKLIKGTQYWSSPNIGGSLAGLRYDLSNTILTGRGAISHDAGNAGLMNWDEDIFLTVLSTRLKYKLEANAATTDIDLDDKQVAYIKIVRNANIAPQLIFTNGATTVSSVGSIGWTADLEAGDFVKVGSEEDTAYYQIATIDSVSQVTLTENYGGTSTGSLGTDSKYAWGNYRTDGTPSTDRHIKVANIEDMPFDADTFWLFFRDDNAGISRIYVRFLNAELKQGETITVADQVPAAVLAYMGSASDVDSDPNYADIALSAKLGTENYNSTQGENLTIRASKLTSMMADKAQDKTINLFSDHTTVTNTTNGTAQEITFSGGSGTATVAIPSSDNNNTIGLSGTLSILSGQVAYYQINRNAANAIPNIGSLVVADIDEVPLDENTYIFAYRLTDTTVHLWDGSKVAVGDSIDLATLRGYVQQNKTAKLVRGGTWSWDLLTNTLSNTSSAFIQIAGLVENVNEISAQNIVIPSNGQCAYVSIKRTAGASTLTVNVADIASVPQNDSNFIIARRINDDVIVGTSSFALKNEEYLELDGALAEINRYNSQLNVLAHNPVNSRVRISGSEILKLNGSKLSLEQNNLLLGFAGAEIDFETGEVFEADGLTPFLGGANDFVPNPVAANNFFWYSINLVPNTVGPLNEISARLIITPSIASSAVLATAPKASFNAKGLKLANVYVQEDGAGGILPIEYQNIIQLQAGSGSGGGAASTRDVTQVAHGFSLSQQIYGDETAGYNLADATDATKLTLYTVVAVTDADNFTVQRSNVAEITGHGYIVGEYYFLDPAVLGGVSTVDPLSTGVFGEWSVPAFFVLNDDLIEIINDVRPTAVSTIPLLVAAPVGQVSIWMDDSIPSDHLRLEGQTVSRLAYPQLFGVWGLKYTFGVDDGVTFDLPDFRGLVPRGRDNGAGIDPDAASRTDRGDGTTGDEVGTKQGDATNVNGLNVSSTSVADTHKHREGWWMENFGNNRRNGLGATGTNRNINAGISGFTTGYSGETDEDTHNHIINSSITSSDNETRMKNISSYFIVRASNPAATINDFTLSISSTTGAADAGKVVITGVDGKLDDSFFPDGGTVGFIGDIKHSTLTPAQMLATNGTDWVLADGGSVVGSLYETITGETVVPDLRGVFLRGKNNGRSDGNENPAGEQDIGEFENDTTRTPRNTAFTTGSGGAHSHTNNRISDNAGGSVGIAANGGGSGRSGAGQAYTIVSTSSSHSHSITGGGDDETRVRNVTVNIYIKIN